MATFDEYNQQIEIKLANTSESFFDESMKRTEINNITREITSEYDLAEMKKKATITFSASGIATKPTDYKKMIKLWDTDDNEYQYTVEDIFDKQSDTASYYWTEDYDTSDDTRKLFVKPLDSGTLNIRYYKLITDLTSDINENGLSDIWIETVALGVTMALLRNAGRYDEAQVFEQRYRDNKADTYLRTKNEGGIKQNNRIKSKYERISQLGNTGALYN